MTLPTVAVDNVIPTNLDFSILMEIELNLPAITYPDEVFKEVMAITYPDEFPAITYLNEVPASKLTTLTYIEPDDRNKIELLDEINNMLAIEPPPPMDIDQTLQPTISMENDLTPLPWLPAPLPEIPIMIDQSDDLLTELLQPAITFPADVTLTTLGFNISNSIAIENVPQRN